VENGVKLPDDAMMVKGLELDLGFFFRRVQISFLVYSE